jgi:nitroreductase
MTPTIDLLRSHRSIRHFTDAPIGDEQREAIIASAQGPRARAFYNAAPLFASPILSFVSSWSR